MNPYESLSEGYSEIVEDESNRKLLSYTGN